MSEKWSGIYGQKTVKEILDRFISLNKIPQAIIFHGSSGVGKDYIAVRLAHLLNLKSKNLLVEPDYRFLNKIREPEIKYIFPLPVGTNETSGDNPYEKLPKAVNEQIQEYMREKTVNPYLKTRIPKANFIKINSIRNINKFLSLRFSEVEYSVILISDAHLMNESAQNALLKNLEEPPEHIIFVLTTNNLEALRETIRSRCWIIDFQPLSENDISSALIEYFDVDRRNAGIVAPFAEGSLERALQLIELDMQQVKASAIEFLRNSLAGRFHSAKAVMDNEMKKYDAALMTLYLKMVLHWLGDVRSYQAGSEDLYFRDYPETFERFTSKFPHADLESAFTRIEHFIHIMNNHNTNINIILSNTILELAVVTNPSIKTTAKIGR